MSNESSMLSERGGGGKASIIISSISSGFNSGTTILPTVTYNGDGTVTISEGSCSLFDDTEFHGFPDNCSIPESTLPLLADKTNFLCAKIDSGVISYCLIDTRTDINASNIFPICYFYYDEASNSLTDPVTYGLPGLGLVNKHMLFFASCDRFRVETGCELSSGATNREIIISPGITWTAGINRVIRQQLNSSTSETLLFYNDASGQLTQKSTITQWDNLHYNSPTGLTELSDGNYGVVFVWRSMGDTSSTIICYLGTEDYLLADAIASSVPMVRSEMVYEALPVGKIVFKKGENVPYGVYPSGTSSGTGSGSSVSHESTLDLLGGDIVHGHYHGNQNLNTDQNVEFSTIVLNSTTKGFVPPRMTTVQRLAVASPTVGSIVFDTDVACLMVFNLNWTQL